MLSTDTKFEDIILDYGTSNSYIIYARGHKLEMGEHISMKGEGSPILIGGENGKDVSKSEIIVRSGRYSAIYGGGFLERSGVHGNVTIELYGGEVTGDIYAGSQNTGLISTGTTEIKLFRGTVGGLVCGTSKLLGLENSNDVNIYLLGTKVKEVYGGYVGLSENDDDTGLTTITVEKSCTLNKLVGFTKLDINKGVTLEVKEVLNHKGGIRVLEDGGEICFNGNSKLIVPPEYYASDRQVGWLKSNGQGNEIIICKDKYLSLTSEREDEINNSIILDFKNTETITGQSILLKYENNPQKSNVTKFTNGTHLPRQVIKADKSNGSVYID